MTPERQRRIEDWIGDVNMDALDAVLGFCAEEAAEVREKCASVADERATLWRSHGGAQMASPYSHLTVEGECEVIARFIRERP